MSSQALYCLFTSTRRACDLLYLPQFYDGYYDLEARDSNVYGLDSRSFQDVYLDGRELPYENVVEREYEDSGLWERDGLFSDEVPDFVSRELYDDYDLYTRDYDDLERRQFEPEFVERDYGFEYGVSIRLYLIFNNT